jgi:uroporphyrinogen III methyltransferase/synthase
MGVRSLSEIASALIEGGMPPEIPAAAIQWGTHPRQRTVVATLDTLVDRANEAGLTAPVITVIGYSVILRDELNWFETRPLFGRRIVVTRAAAQASGLSEKLRDLGADVIEMPATRIARLDLAPLRDAISGIREYSWLIFTSQNAVSIFWEQLLGGGRDARALAGVRIAAIGPATAAALLEHGIVVDVVPERFVAESLLEKLSSRDDVANSSILYVTAEGARDILPAGLARIGANVDRIKAYKSITDGAESSRLSRTIEKGGIDLVTFTSASSVRGYVDVVGEELSRRVPAASIGPVTSEAINEAGIELTIEASESTIDGLVDAIQRSLE